MQAEGRHAEERRSDIIAICARHTVPMEIKKADSRDLWTAIERQLIPRYLRDPKCGGYGIFLVFWHGHDHLGISPPNGPPPGSPEELRKQLEAPLTPAQRSHYHDQGCGSGRAAGLGSPRRLKSLGPPRPQPVRCRGRREAVARGAHRRRRFGAVRWRPSAVRSGTLPPAAANREAIVSGLT